MHQGLAKTGVVGTLKRGNGPAIGLRADMDALPMEELNDFAHRSSVPGKFHGCGHDGHTAMLLGAARYLAETGNFDGTVHFIFQPAEENVAGGGVMVAEGLVREIPDASRLRHAQPAEPAARRIRHAAGAGTRQRRQFRHRHPWARHACSVAASRHRYRRWWRRRSSRPCRPSSAVRPRRSTAAVVSVTSVHGGSTDNVIPDEIRLRGTARSFLPHVQDRIELSLRQIAMSTAAMFGATAEVEYERRYPSLHNDPERIAACAEVARAIVGDEHVDTDHEPGMGSDDFSFMANRVPGGYVWIGSGPVEAGRFLHNPRYDFNDGILPIGASYWARLVESQLPRKA